MGDAISGAFDFFGGAADTATSAVSDAASGAASGVADAATALAAGATDLFGGTGTGAAAGGPVSDLVAGTGAGGAAGDALALAPAGSSLPAAVSPAASQALDQNIIQDVAGGGAGGDVALKGPAGLEGPIVAPAADAGVGTAATSGLGASDLLKAPDAAPTSDPLQAELTAAGVNATGSNAAQVATVDSALGPPAPAPPGLFKQATDFLATPGGKLGVAALPLAATLLRGEPSLPPQFGQLQDVTGPLSATAKQQLALANAGQVSPGEAATVAQYVQGATSQLYQQLANEGIADPRQDSRWIAGQGAIQQQAAVMTQQFITQEFQQAFAASGAASTNLIAAAEAQIQEDQAFNQALSAAFTSFGLLSFLGSKGGP